MFGVVGAIATPAHYATLILLVEMAGVTPVLATVAGSAVGALVNYLLNHRYTYRSNKAHLDAGPKFLMVALITGILNAFLLYLGVDVLGVHYLPAQVVTTLFVFVANFVLHSIWTFEERNPT